VLIIIFPQEFHHPFASVKAQSEASEEEGRSRPKLLFNANNCREQHFCVIKLVKAIFKMVSSFFEIIDQI